ncbi:MAG: hypothetical protein MZV63_19415 [Marinilabiliales bacterium]|nr:hypothetical protein [Marinilabiliales bacterium]
MEGPTPSSALFYGAVMVHAGVYLVLRLQPLFEQSPALMACDGGDRPGDRPLRIRGQGWRRPTSRAPSSFPRRDRSD